MLVLFLAVITGFVFWVMATQAGTRWALEVGAGLADAQVESVQGTFREGLKVGLLRVDSPAVKLVIEDLDLQIVWSALRERRLHVRNVSAGLLSLDLLETAPSASDKPFQWPVLPVTMSLDRVAVNAFSLALNGQPQGVEVADFDASLVLNQADGQLVLRQLIARHEGIQAGLAGELQLLALAAPWPFSVQIDTHAQSTTPDSFLCARHFLPEYPGPSGVKADQGDEPGKTAHAGSTTQHCNVDLKAKAQGSQDVIEMTLDGVGQGLKLATSLSLAPSQMFPLRMIDASLELPDTSSARVQLDWSSQERTVEQTPLPGPDVTVIQAPAQLPRHSLDHVTGQVSVNRLNLGWLVGKGLPEAMLTAVAKFDATLHDQTRLQLASLGLSVNGGSRWNGRPLGADLSFDVRAVEAVTPEDPGYQVDELRLDLRLADNRVQGSGQLGWTSTQLQLAARLPRLADFWPELEGAADLDARLRGAVAAHDLELKAVYDMGPKGGTALADAPLVLNTRVEGGYGVQADSGKEGWTGRVTRLELMHAGLGGKALQAIPVQFYPRALAPDYQWQVGATRLELALPSRTTVLLDHARSFFSPGRWSTQGDIDRLVLSKRIIDEVTQLIAAANPSARADRGRIIVDIDDRNDLVEMSYALNWDFAFAGALSGRAQVRHLSGDLIVPGNPPFPLGLQTFQVDMVTRPVANGNSGGRSTVGIDVKLETVRMGKANARIETLLRATPGGAFSVSTKDPTTLKLDADIADLAWLGLFVGDETDIGGALAVNVQAASRPDGTWQTSGTLTGDKIRVVRIDDGVRLIDGTLKARMEGERLVVDSLAFPALRRAVPKESRTEEWTRLNPEAQGGSLKLSGHWDVNKMGGNFLLDFYRYPIMQRSDRFAMVTAKINVGLPSEKIDIKGKVMVDAGWVDLDMLSSVPTLDSDVVVVRAGAAPAPVAKPVNLSLDLDVDLGPRFYITGYGIDSGLVGQLQVLMSDGKLVGYGGLRTRGGSVEAYGQRLRLRQGTITFQGDITNPVLNIQALRTGAAVEAGVRVSGTPRRPKIDLVSYPDVSEVQKLSWLLLGRGPDDSGGDAALLFSVGTSFLGSGEPFYKKFGLDEVSMRSGELGSVGSILPAESVVRGLDSGTSDIERKFMVAAKDIGAGFRVSLEQSLSETGTVGRVTYRLAQGLSAQISAGTVNGLALIYRYVVRE